jgi:glutathione S-transferase
VTDEPVLWHIPVSHYNEKVRWALAYKGVEHERRAPMPGAHVLVSLWLTRGSATTFPVLRLDGRNIGDSTAIIAALEERHPEPALYPDDPGERARALAIEGFFDEELGPHIRLLAYHELMADRERFREFAETMSPSALRRGAGRFASSFLNLRFRVSDPARVELARRKVVGAFDRLDAELVGREYLVGDEFTVADLTAASLLYPAVAPPEGPDIPEPTPDFERFLAPLRERPGFRWVAEMFARHRKPAAA